MVQIILATLGLAVAALTTRQCARYQLMGMPAGMAAMMAAMGTGLSVGYAAGMSLDLGTATLIGVVAGGVQGLWLGRVWGPSAALEGASGGAMGGLMGPMLSVMLLYLPTSVVLAAILMLVLQVLLSGAAVYLAADTAGVAPSTRWQRAIGRLLGASAQPGQDYYATLGVRPEASATEIAEGFLTVSRRTAHDPERMAAARQALDVLTDPLRRAKFDVARLEALACCPPAEAACPSAAPAHQPLPRSQRRPDRRARQPQRTTAPRFGFQTWALVLGAVVLAFLMLRAGPELTGSSAPAQSDASAGGEAQSVAMNLDYPYYEPELVQVQKGRPVALTISSLDPG